jgi:hypothetical protein
MMSNNLARHLKLAEICQEYEFHRPRTNLCISAQVLLPTHAHSKHTFNAQLREFVLGKIAFLFNHLHSKPTPTRMPD